MSPRLLPLPAVTVDGVRFLVDMRRPVAFLKDGHSRRFVTWPDAAMPPLACSARLVGAPDAVWVVYEEATDSPGSSVVPPATAVRIGTNGSVSSIELGRATAIGADARGLWTSPRATPEPEGLDARSGHTEDWDAEARAEFDRARILPVESWQEFNAAEAAWNQERFATQRASYLARMEAAGGDSQAGDETSGSFVPMRIIDTPIDDDDELDDDARSEVGRFADIPAPGPSDPVTLSCVHADGTIETLSVNRTVGSVQADGSLTRLTFYPTNPVGTSDHGGKHVSWLYPESTISVDFSAGIPTSLRVEDHEATELREDDEFEDDEDDDDDEYRLEADIPAEDKPSLDGVRGIDWEPAEPDSTLAKAAIDRLMEELRGLDSSDTISTVRDDRIHHVESPYYDVRVWTRGAWPQTTVSVKFRNREYGEHGRLYRRDFPIFTPAGRLISYTYVTVFLEEDLATGADLIEQGDAFIIVGDEIDARRV